jgi:hypothetical protein
MSNIINIIVQRSLISAPMYSVVSQLPRHFAVQEKKTSALSLLTVPAWKSGSLAVSGLWWMSWWSLWPYSNELGEKCCENFF